MKVKINNVNSCTRMVDIEVSADELAETKKQVYTDIGKNARIPGFRPGKVPRDILENYYARQAEEELIRRAIPKYCSQAVAQEKLEQVAPSQIEDVKFKDRTLFFKARIDVRPQIKLNEYKKLKIRKKKVKIGQSQLDQMLEKLRQAKAKPAKEDEKAPPLPELNDDFATGIGFASLQALKDTVHKNLQENEEAEANRDMRRQVLDHLLKKISLDVPQSLVDSQTKQLLGQMKMDHVLHGEKKDAVEAQTAKLKQQAAEQAVRMVKLAFILDEIALKENIQVTEDDLEKRIETIARRSAKSKEEVKQYLLAQNMIPGLIQQMREAKTAEFLFNQAEIEEEK